MNFMLLDSSFNKDSIGENIMRLRKELRMTQEKLAELTGLSCNSIINYEKGRRIPTVENIYKLSSALGADVIVLTQDNGLSAGETESSSQNEITIKATVSDKDVVDFAFSTQIRKDITAEELNALFDEAKARVWGFLQPVKG